MKTIKTLFMSLLMILSLALFTSCSPDEDVLSGYTPSELASPDETFKILIDKNESSWDMKIDHYYKGAKVATYVTAPDTNVPGSVESKVINAYLTSDNNIGYSTFTVSVFFNSDGLVRLTDSNFSHDWNNLDTPYFIGYSTYRLRYGRVDFRIEQLDLDSTHLEFSISKKS